MLSLNGASVKIADFGSAMEADEHVNTDYMQPRYYRAPEVILGQPYDTQIDMWSLGATLFELAMGYTLFKGHNNNAMLYEMLKVCGPFPKDYVASGEFSSKHFKESFSERGREIEFLNASGEYSVEAQNPKVAPMSWFDGPRRPLGQLLDPDAMPDPPPGVEKERLLALTQHFQELIGLCLVPRPSRRATPESALAHRFFEKGAGS